MWEECGRWWCYGGMKVSPSSQPFFSHVLILLLLLLLLLLQSLSAAV